MADGNRSCSREWQSGIIASMPLDLLQPLLRDWFAQRFGEPTEPQRLGWPSIAAGRNTLIAAPTGSGKTLAAFMFCLDRLFRQGVEGELPEGVEVVYVSPLRALSNDIRRNLETPLAEIREFAAVAGVAPPAIRTAVRTGDTPASERQAMTRRPPHILVTTPESLYLLLTSAKSRDMLRTTRTVIVDEIHALARDKRGSHLTLTLERLAALTERRPARIGLSATQRPIEDLAQFLVGVNADSSPGECEVIDVGHRRELDLALETPPSDLAAVCSHEQWGEVYERLAQLVQSHRSTLVFVNTRRLAERVTHRLSELLGEDAVASHHGSLSKQLRHDAEQRLKEGKLKAIVATASLEMGIDIGYIDLVCQIGSPRSIAAFLQRVGRSGHSLGATPKGRLFPLTRDEMLECLALVRAVRQGKLDAVEIPQAALDILAQQIVATVACDDWSEDELFSLCRRAWPYRNLPREDFETILTMLSEGVTANSKRGAWLHRDRIHGQLRARRGARLAAITSGGAIPENADYRVVTEDDGAFVGTVDEDFALESLAGDVFLLGNTSWRIRHVRGGEVVVRDAAGAPPTIPFWLGEAPGRTIELSDEISQLRADIASRSRPPDETSGEETTFDESSPAEFDYLACDRTDSDSQDFTPPPGPVRRPGPTEWLEHECGANSHSAEQAIRYVVAQQDAIGVVPTHRQIVFERFFDESGGMQLVIHAPLGARINRAWGLALRKRFCRSFDFELQAAADDDGVVLSLGPQHSFAIESLFPMLGPHNAKYLLEQAVLAAPMFQLRWRWNVTRALAVLRRQGGKRVPPFLQKYRAEDVLAAAFPETVGCLENHHGDVEIPDHPLVRQTMHDCLHEAMDLDRWVGLLRDVKEGRVELIARDTREPSPFCAELINANPYAFLDDAPLEERRTRAVAMRRTLSREQVSDLTKLDSAAIDAVAREAWPVVRDAEELHDALMNLVAIHAGEGEAWAPWFAELTAAGRATRVRRPGKDVLWIAAERWPLIRAIYEDATCDPPLSLPASLDVPCDNVEARIALVRGRIEHSGPMTAARLAALLDLEVSQVGAALEALEGKGIVMRGRFTDGAQQTSAGDPVSLEWCERRLLARIHRMTLDGLRRQIQPVTPADFLRYLVRHQRVERGRQTVGPGAVREVLELLQGFETPAAAWEDRLLSARIQDYDPQSLDALFLSGEAMWGRLRPPRSAGPDRESRAAMHRALPISLLLRKDLSWLIDEEREPINGSNGARSNAELVRDALQSRGALFFQELTHLVDLPDEYVQESLRELAARGLVTCDAFASVRAIAAGAGRRNGRGRRNGKTATPASGRWSLFPGFTPVAAREDRLEAWCRQLLRRYGVVFRELLTRESAAPSWYELTPTFRRLELMGKVRGGRFVADVGGEQFGTEEAVRMLRQVRDEPAEGRWVCLSAADPLNLLGIITPDPRLPASHTHTFILREGRCAAVRHSSETHFQEELPPTEQADMWRALQLGSLAPQATSRSHRERNPQSGKDGWLPQAAHSPGE
jgi:ATP-dependent helicase Lhr and Lhr-like helicase